jgi:3-oxoacyl-[acyl-carrier protein] reductase
MMQADMASESKAKLSIPDLKGKAVLITGASTGIGAELVRGFAAQGSRVGLHYNSSEAAARSLSDEVKAAGGDVFLVRGDFSVMADVERVVKEVAAHFGRLDGLINNAGGMLGRVPYSDLSDDQYDAVMNLNAKSVIVASRTAIPWLKKNGGFIINTTSIAARNGASGGAGLYGSSKAFVSNVTRGLAKELIGDRIRVNAVAPGVILTPFHERYSTPAQLEALKTSIPQGRLAEADECLGAYLFLASEMLSPYIVGQVIEVNGGQLMP